MANDMTADDLFAMLDRLHVPHPQVRVVPDHYGACPRCGAYWGHPDKDLDYPNRQKVDQFWRCYNPNCTCGYYDPELKQVVEDKLSPEEDRKMRERVHREVTEMMRGKKWAVTSNFNGHEVHTLVPDPDYKEDEQ